jgi:hypothetical protein
MPKGGLEFRRDAILGAGMLAGLLFVLFEMTATAFMRGPSYFVMPLKMIGAIILGPVALEPTPLWDALATTGILLHIALSLTFASIFAAVVSREWSTAALAIAGMMFGFSLWILNFYLVAPIAGWWWFRQSSSPIIQIIAHVCFYGCSVGWLLSRARLKLPT